jgi:histidyl-tRNA synthetase
VHAGGGSLKSQMKKADASGAVVALIIGDDEVAAGTVTLKPLRVAAPQSVVPVADVAARAAAFAA